MLNQTHVVPVDFMNVGKFNMNHEKIDCMNFSISESWDKSVPFLYEEEGGAL